MSGPGTWEHLEWTLELLFELFSDCRGFGRNRASSGRVPTQRPKVAAPPFHIPKNMMLHRVGYELQFEAISENCAFGSAALVPWDTEIFGFPVAAYKPGS